MVAFKKELREEISKLMHSICVQYDNLEMRIQSVEEKMEKVLSKLKKEEDDDGRRIGSEMPSAF